MLDSKKLSGTLDSKDPKIRKEKDSILLLNERYNTPGTSLLLFHFEPQQSASSDLRLKNCSIQHHIVEEKDIYIFDNFFTESEGNTLRDYSRTASFSRSSYASQESREKGEEPARSMNNREKWEFFAKPPQPIKEIYRLLGTCADRMNADISTLPWDLCDQNICASAIASNKLEKVSRESMEMGKHEDFNTEEGIPFGIPILYAKEKSFYPGNFVNGALGNPLLLSLMVYAAEDNFLGSKYGIGTIFCKKNGEIALKAECQHMRFVLFDGEILHSIEESTIPPAVHTWRVSYVFKLIINPRSSNQNLRAAFQDLLNMSSSKP